MGIHKNSPYEYQGIFKEQKKFEDRLQQLQNLEVNHKENEILTLLCDISL